ncbi:putative phage tail protein [Methylosinus sp. H3A]|uniref:putative phage tail protein n=1 Tax=Methylosinus sp. H3A TaxID=2785786 RepID=UPI001FF027EE|nr:putative phage tail protein [Methylosinus sp. H3A]
MPDPCLAGVTQTVERRKLFLRMRIAAKGGQSIAYFICLAATLGYEIAISESRPFRCGQGRCGKTQIGSANNEVIWRVYVTIAGSSSFRA